MEHHMPQNNKAGGKSLLTLMHSKDENMDPNYIDRQQ